MKLLLMMALTAACAAAARGDTSVAGTTTGAAAKSGAAATGQSGKHGIAKSAPVKDDAVKVEAVGPCGEERARARKELLERGFDPARDTDAALQVHAGDDGGWELSAHVAAAADSLHESFELTIAPVATRGTTAWSRRSRPICCEDQAEQEDHVVEVIARRRARGRAATITTVTGRYPERARWVALFTSIARRAADVCLAAP